MTRFRTNPRDGFALVFALGVLAILVMVMVAAANSAQVTYGFAAARARDQQILKAIDNAVLVLAARQWPQNVESAPMKEETLFGSGGVTVRGLEADPELTGALPSRPGDFLLELTAASGTRQRVSVFLFNARGDRRGPILLNEKRK